MWLWQRKNMHKRHLLWLKLFGVCLFIHCLFLSWVFFISHDKSHALSLSLSKHIDYSAPILFVPLSQKSIIQKNEPLINHHVTPLKQNTAPKATTTTITPPKPVINKKIVAPTAPPKQEKPVIKKDTLQATATSSHNQEIKPEEKKLSVPEQKKVQQLPMPNTHQAPEKLIVPENAHISHDYREVEAMRRTALLQKELINNWKPPIGVPTTASCEVQFTVSVNGSVKDATTIKSSGIMMYDVAARHAVFSIKMPAWTYGKTITIAFKQ